MVVIVAEGVLGNPGPLEKQADVVLVGDPNTPVELERLLGDPDPAGSELVLRRRDIAAP